MIFFHSEPAFCAICKTKLKHKHKPKKEWKIEGPHCGNCHVDKMNEFYEASIRQNCIQCGIKKEIAELWEPRWQWEMEGLLCKNCFDKKESDFNKKKEYCSICGIKLGFFRYNPKPKWNLEGQVCRDCWDSRKAQNG